MLPNGQRSIRVFPEWVGGWPLWENFTGAYRLTGSDLGLSPVLSDELCQWNETWLSRDEDDPVPDGWRERGLELVHRLRAELADAAEVRPEFLG